MRDSSDDPTAPAVAPKKTPRATRLLQAAALAAVLVPLGTVAVETATISLVTGTSGTGCFGAGCSDSGLSNTWEFYSSYSGGYQGFLYSIQISTPLPLLGTYSLNVGDYVALQFGAGPLNGTFTGLTCVPNYDGVNHCGLFNVIDVSPLAPARWPYDVAIQWTAKQPTLTQWVTILKGPNVPGYRPFPEYNFNTHLADSWYYPDPGIGGRGNGFSAFGAFIGNALSFEIWGIPAAVQVDPVTLQPVPDAASSMILFGIGLSGLAAIRRRWKT